VKLNRRNVLAGLGTAAAGTAAIFGTGAFENEVDRAFTVSVSGDESEEVQLPINSNVDGAGRINFVGDEAGNDILEVDATNLPEEATVTLGEFEDDDDVSTLEDGQGVFTIENQNALEEAIDLGVELSEAGDATVEVAIRDAEDVETFTQGDEDPAEITNIGVGEEVDVGIRIDTDSEEDVDVDLTIHAEVSDR